MIGLYEKISGYYVGKDLVDFFYINMFLGWLIFDVTFKLQKPLSNKTEKTICMLLP